MTGDLRDKIKAATEESGISKPDFLALLKLIDQHYDKMEATITQSLESQSLQTQTPIEAIFDSVTDALMSVDGTGTIRNCNKICGRYFGVPRRQLIGTNLNAILFGLENQTLGEFLSPFLSNLDDTHPGLGGGDIKAMRADGSIFDVRINASILETVGGDVYVISMRDISDRMRAEVALRENEERYRALVENAPEAIIVYDVDENRFTDANDIACTLFNLSRARLLTVGPEAISPKKQPDGTPSFGVRRGYLDAALEGEHPTFEWMHKDSNGRRIPCEVRFSRLPSDDKRLIRVSITDIEERKRNEALAHAQNKVLEMIAAGTPYDRTLRAICRFVEKIGPGFKAAIMALDAKTGETAWKTPRNQEVKRKFSFATPLVIEQDGGEQIISQASGFVGAYAPADGRLIHDDGVGVPNAELVVDEAALSRPVRTDDADLRLSRVLTNDPGTGVMRHVDAGYPRAIEVADERGVRIPR